MPIEKWVQCLHCLYCFDVEKHKKNSGEVWLNGQIVGYICPNCSPQNMDEKRP